MQHTGYFDANATTPLLPGARQVLVEALDRQWHNPSALYHPAGAARRSLEEARERLAERLGVDDAHRIVFTSGATESNNLILRHFASITAPSAAILTSRVEHPCVREPAAALFPGRVIEAPFDLGQTLDLIRDRRPAVVSVMAANNETGVVPPWREIRRLCRELQIPFHSDAAQWLGKMALEEIGSCDWLTGSAHKFGGPKGAGFLVVPGGLERMHGSLLGGPQEDGRRAGTENVPAILAMVAALEEAESLRLACDGAGRDAFEARVQQLIPGTRFAGAGLPRLWNTSLCILPEFGQSKWLSRLSHLGYHVSTGSACSSGAGHASHVMEAMGLGPPEAGRVLRASAHWMTTIDNWLALSEALHEVWTELRNPSTASRAKRRLQL